MQLSGLRTSAVGHIRAAHDYTWQLCESLPNVKVCLHAEDRFDETYTCKDGTPPGHGLWIINTHGKSAGRSPPLHHSSRATPTLRRDHGCRSL
jgi:hypothetical protein